MRAAPHLSVAWQHAFDDVTPDAALTFVATGILLSARNLLLERHQGGPRYFGIKFVALPAW